MATTKKKRPAAANGSATARSARRRVEAADPSAPAWYKNAIIYQLHVRSFCDSTADGIGDFKGLISRLDYLQDLGITAIWLLPFYPSPLRDDGYDIADYMSVNPSYGTFDDVRRFIDEAHRRDLRVITELVINHTSDQHPWFQRARNAPIGSKLRDFYVWSDSADLYKETRIIFKDFETSNWAWDPVAMQYYWHRFYSHQPDLNFDNPAVHEAILKVCDHWLDTGVDGMRLDAVPYLYEREGTNCENLKETHGFLKKMRAHVDKNYPGRMLLAEANQWPEDAIAYFGEGDECHMAFHFPLMPRLFMSIRMEDRFPIIDIMDQTPAIPAACQWAVFLRNHDELTLEMVTDEERDYMYRVYATDREARINLGIRRRLAPLLANNRRKIELMNALLFSMPGTPVIYYGDEVGMGDNVYLGDRNGVRTPMQWSGDRNAGFSRAGPQRLFLPVIIDPEYHYETVNVESQQANPSSLLWWMKRLIALRTRHPVFGQGEIEFLGASNPKVLAFVRRDENETVLVVANLSRFVQPTDLDLAKFRDLVPTEMFGMTPFPQITDRPYFLTLGPHSFYWFTLEQAHAGAPGAAPGPVAATIGANLTGGAAQWLGTDDSWPDLSGVLARDIRNRRWFAAKARTFRSLRVTESIPIKAGAAQRACAYAVLMARVEYADAEPDVYAIPVGMCEATRYAEVFDSATAPIMAHVEDEAEGGEDHDYVLFDAMCDAGFAGLLMEMLSRGKGAPGQGGELVGSRTKAFELSPAAARELPVRASTAEQSNSSAMFGDRYVMKLFRRIESGTNPDLEICRHLTERVGFAHTPALAGAIEYRVDREESRSLVMLQRFVPNQGDAWSYTLDHLGDFYERALALPPERAGVMLGGLPPSALEAAGTEMSGEWIDQLAGHAASVELLGRRTAEMHAALADAPGDAAFAPEAYTTMYQRSLAQSMRNTVRRTMAVLRKRLDSVPATAREEASELLGREEEMVAFFRVLSSGQISAKRIRCHGDYHLGQVLWTGKDFAIIDFEGEPLKSLGERRLKRSPLRDVAGMLRSFQYAAYTGLSRHAERGGAAPIGAEGAAGAGGSAANWARAWEVTVGGAFVRSYLATIGEADGSLLPSTGPAVRAVLNAWLMEKALYEIGYELNSRPAWVGIPLRAAREILSQGQ